MMIHIKSPYDGLAMGTKVTDTESGEEIHGIAEIHVHFVPEDMVKADITLNGVVVDSVVSPTFWLTDPSTGTCKPVARVVYADGSEWSAP